MNDMMNKNMNVLDEGELEDVNGGTSVTSAGGIPDFGLPDDSVDPQTPVKQGVGVFDTMPSYYLEYSKGLMSK